MFEVYCVWTTVNPYKLKSNERVMLNNLQTFLSTKIAQSMTCLTRWNNVYVVLQITVRSVLHTKLQTCPQLPRGMQRIRGPFILIIILTYLETLCTLTLANYIISFVFIHICTLLFISCILPPTFFHFSHVFTLHLYISLTRNTFSYPWWCRRSAKAWIF